MCKLYIHCSDYQIHEVVGDCEIAGLKCNYYLSYDRCVFFVH